MKPIILGRKSYNLDDETKEEFEIAEKYFSVIYNRTALPKDSKDIVGRYSCLPFYYELENDLKQLNSSLINSYEQHWWIANFDYYHDLADYTFPTWTEDNFRFCEEENSAFVVKGKTNSRKHRWNKLMFAENKEAAIKLSFTLNDDMMIGEQGIIFRKYIPLKLIETGLNGLPFVNEFRFFYYKEKMLSNGFYWNNMTQYPEKANLTQEGIDFANKVASIAAKHCNFFVLDIAEKEEGDWILVEINDGQCSGLSDNNPDILYKNLAEALS